MQKTAMCWGFDVGDGWYGLLAEAAAELEPLIVAYIKSHPEEQNRFPRFLFSGWYGMKWSTYHLWLAICTVGRWIKAELWPDTAEPWWPRACQVKEKFATLHFYMTGSTKEMDTIIDKAERRSSMTCETCGKPGKLRCRTSWFYTACNRHTKKEDKE